MNKVKDNAKLISAVATTIGVWTSLAYWTSYDTTKGLQKNIKTISENTTTTKNDTRLNLLQSHRKEYSKQYAVLERQLRNHSVDFTKVENKAAVDNLLFFLSNLRTVMDDNLEVDYLDNNYGYVLNTILSSPNIQYDVFKYGKEKSQWSDLLYVAEKSIQSAEKKNILHKNHATAKKSLECINLYDSNRKHEQNYEHTDEKCGKWFHECWNNMIKSNKQN